MNGIYSSVLMTLIFIIIVKIVSIWVKQLYTLLICKVPGPGLPLPIFGHSYHFIGTAPEETLEVTTRLVKEDVLCKKVD